MNLKPTVLLALSAAALIGTTLNSSAALTASDNASNYPSDYTWPNGSNFGYGFQSWNLVPYGSAGTFTAQGVTSIGTGTNLQAFDLYANSGGFATAQRYFTNDSDTGSGALDIGQTFSLTLAAPSGISSSGGAGDGVSLEVGGTTEFNLQYSGSTSGNYLNYTDATNTDTVISGIGDSNLASGLTLSFTLTGGDNYTATISAVGGSVLDTINGTVSSNAIDNFVAYDYNSGNGQDFVINNLSVESAPEPSVVVLLAGGLLGLMLVVRRKFFRV